MSITDNIRRTRDGYYSVRIRAGRHPRTGKGQQIRVTIPTTDEAVFRERLARLRELSAALIPEGLTAEASVAIKKAAAQDTDAKFNLMCETALSLAPEVRARPKGWNTFRELAEAWTRGELHRSFPDHVKEKRTSKRDKGRLEALFDIVVEPTSKRTLGDMPLTLITFAHANTAMVNLPETCKRPAARRQYAQLIGRVMKLAVFPAACIAASPLPRGFLPRVPEGDLIFPHLYPDEDLKFMRCALVEYAVRALFGLCNREGGRLGEFLRGLKWSGIDPRRGTITLPGGALRKGGKPGKWQAEPGSLEALEPLRALGGAGPFLHLPDDGQWAERLQEAMRAAKLDREALYHSNVAEGFRRMRGHDTRATYVTLALAAGLSESHIMARTGHTTSKMVHRYDHAAEALAASDGGCRLMPLDYALGLYPLASPPPSRRAGWMTLDPRSPEAAILVALAMPAEHPTPLLGPGGDDDPLGGLRETIDTSGETIELSGETPPLERETPNKDPAPGASSLARAPTATTPGLVQAGDGGPPGCGAALLEQARERDGGLAVAGVDGSVSGGPDALEQDSGELVGLAHDVPVAGLTTGFREGETKGVTNSLMHGVCVEPCGKESSMIHAVAPAGLEPASPFGRGILSSSGPCTSAQPDELTPRNPVAGSNGKAHEVSPATPWVRPPEAPPEASDPVLAALSIAAHVAIDGGDTATVTAIIAAMDRRRTTLAGVGLEATATIGVPARGAV